MLLVTATGSGVPQTLWRIGYWLDDQGPIRGRGNCRTFFSFPPLPDRLWGTPSLISNGYPAAITPG